MLSDSKKLRSLFMSFCFGSLLLVAGILSTLDSQAQEASGAEDKTEASGQEEKDISASFQDQALEVKRGLKEENLLKYNIVSQGEITASSQEVVSLSSTTTSLALELNIKENQEEEFYELEARYNEIAIEHTINGESWSYYVAQEGDGQTWKNGVPLDPEKATNIPLPSALKENLSKPVAYGNLNGEHYQLENPCHGVAFGNADGKNNPARLIDPLVFLPLLFAGYAEHDNRVGEAFQTEAMISLDTKQAKLRAYTLSLTLKEVFGKEAAKPLRARYTFEATPTFQAEPVDYDGFKLQQPKLNGEIELDPERGIILFADIKAEYQKAEGAEEGVSGYHKITFNLDEQEE